MGKADSTASNVDASELARFEATASRWWDADGVFAPLHRLNPLRVDYIVERCGDLEGERIADIGCGGGLLSTALAQRGANVTGADLGETAIQVAQLKALELELEIDYRRVAAESLATEAPGQFALVTCMELLEHVPQPESVVGACAELAAPGGDVVFSTINRNPKSYLLAVLGAEYVLNWVPRGTHDYAKFIKPSELARWARRAGLQVQDVRGVHFDPVRQRFYSGGNADVNYMIHCAKV